MSLPHLGGVSPSQPQLPVAEGLGPSGQNPVGAGYSQRKDWLDAQICIFLFSCEEPETVGHWSHSLPSRLLFLRAPRWTEQMYLYSYPERPNNQGNIKENSFLIFTNHYRAGLGCCSAAQGDFFIPLLPPVFYNPDIHV